MTAPGGREDAARAFAEAIGWRKIGANVLQPRRGEAIIVPAPDAPLHEHLAFVGRVAEAIGPDRLAHVIRLQTGWAVGILDEAGEIAPNCDAMDPSWAALIAATEARRAK